MDITTLLRKLHPLIPKEVERWRATLPFLNVESRSLLEQEIKLTAERVLGNYWNKVLLTLPPKKALSGPFQLGTVQYETPKHEAGWKPSELLQHTAIFGRSGAGKSNVVFLLIEQLSNAGIPWLFLDWKRTAREMLPLLKERVQVFTPGRSLSPMAFNPFLVPPGLDASVYVTQLVDVLAESFTLGDGARSVLQKALAVCYAQQDAPTLLDVIRAVETLPATQRVHGWKITALRALESLRFGNVLPVDRDEQAGHTRTLLKQSTIVELDALSQGAKAFLVPMLCLWLYYVQFATRKREQLRYVIVIEEAHHVLYRGTTRRHETVMNMLLRQCRELGIGIIVVDQHPHLISAAALGNAYTTICLNLKDPADLTRAAGLLQLDDGERRHLSSLEVGRGICRKQNGHGPFLVRFPLGPVRKGSVTDERLVALLRGHEPRSAWKADLTRESTHVSRISSLDRSLDEPTLRFLQDVIDHPDDPIRTRHRRVGISVRLGQRIKDHLIQRGWLDAALIPIGNTRKLVLRVTPQGRAFLGLSDADIASSEQRRESVAHAYWKQFYADQFRAMGYRVEMERARTGGHIDVLAVNDSERIGIEIETGQSDVVRNVRNGLRSGFDRMLVVATDEAAMQRVARQLGRSGLLIPSRVELVLRDRTTA